MSISYFTFSIIDNKRCLVLANIIRKIYFINNLKRKILIRNDILMPKNFLIDLTKHKTMISSCNITIQNTIKPR